MTPPEVVEQSLAPGERAARDTAVRAGGEILGKLASLALFIGIARMLGESNLGDFVFAFAWTAIATVVIELGYDPYLTRKISAQPGRVDLAVPGAIILKSVRAVPVTVASIGLLLALGYGGQARDAVFILSAGMLLDSFTRTVVATFTALERGWLVGITVVVQRVVAAGLGLGALAAGAGIVTVAACYTAGSAAGIALSIGLLASQIGLPRSRPDRTAFDEMRKESPPFAAKDILSVLLDRLDTVLLSLLATTAAVGLYGSAYRLLEATFFVGFSIVGAFSAMYVNLDHRTEPTVGSAFERSTKLLLAVLVPVALVFGLLAEPLLRLFFGVPFEAAADALRLLAPTVVAFGVSTLASTLLLFRLTPGVVVRIVGVVLAINIALNLILIPPLDEAGAAAGMLISTTIFALVSTWLAARAVGGISVWRMAGSTAIAGAAMAVPLVLAPPVVGLALGLIAFAVVLAACELAFHPQDARFVLGLARRVTRRGKPAPAVDRGGA